MPPAEVVMFFAEGTRPSTSTGGEFKKGGFVTALEKSFPVLPVTVNGSGKVLSGKNPSLILKLLRRS